MFAATSTTFAAAVVCSGWQQVVVGASEALVSNGLSFRCRFHLVTVTPLAQYAVRRVSAFNRPFARFLTTERMIAL